MGVDSDAAKYVEQTCAHVSNVSELIQTPDIVGVDMLFHAHPLSKYPVLEQTNLLPLQIFLLFWNLLMDEARKYAEKGVNIILLQFDKGCPKLKEEVAGVKRKEKRAPPYGPEDYIDVKTGDFYEKNSFGVVVKQAIVDIKRVISTRDLRLQLFQLFASKFLPLEKLPRKECRYIMDFSVNPALSPVSVDGETKGEIKLEPSLHNVWLESDHSAPRILSKLIKKDKQNIIVYRANDRDMLPILLHLLSTTLNSSEDVMNNEKRMKHHVQIYFNSYRPKAPSASNRLNYAGGLFHINTMMFLMAERHASTEAVMLMFCLCGNDYMEKKDTTPEIGSSTVCKMIHQMGNPTHPKHSILTKLLFKLASYTGTGMTASTNQDYILFRDLIYVLFHHAFKTPRMPPNEQTLKQQYVRLVQVFAYWMECVSFDKPQNALNQLDNNLDKKMSMRSDLSVYKTPLVEGGDFKRSKTPSPHKPPQLTHHNSATIPITLKADPRLKLYAPAITTIAEQEYDPDDSSMNL